jgi:pyridoxine 5-phosphate synthase
MPGGGVYYRGRFSLLFIDVEHIARLREARGGNEPDPVEAAVICEKSGCDGITVHLREDRRPVQDRDVFALKDAISGNFNLEIPLSDEIILLARAVKPHRITLVPESREKPTANCGLDDRANMQKIRETVGLFHDQDIPVSLSVKPDRGTIELSKKCGADFVEIHAGKYGNAVDETEINEEIDKIYRAAEHAVKVGLKVGAAHGLNYKNILPVLKARALEQVTIGHSIISRAVFVGLPKAVQEMLDIID